MDCRTAKTKGINLPLVLFIIFLPPTIWGLAQIVAANLDLSGYVSDKINHVEFTFDSIYMNNVIMINKCVFGFFTFGVTTAINIFATSFYVGAYSRQLLNQGYSVYALLRLLLPQLTEYIAIWMAGSMSFAVSINFLRKDFKINKEMFLKLYIILHLMIVFAAFMEVNFAHLV